MWIYANYPVCEPADCTVCSCLKARCDAEYEAVLSSKRCLQPAGRFARRQLLSTCSAGKLQGGSQPALSCSFANGNNDAHTSQVGTCDAHGGAQLPQAGALSSMPDGLPAAQPSQQAPGSGAMAGSMVGSGPSSTAGTAALRSNRVSFAGGALVDCGDGDRGSLTAGGGSSGSSNSSGGSSGGGVGGSSHGSGGSMLLLRPKSHGHRMSLSGADGNSLPDVLPAGARPSGGRYSFAGDTSQALAVGGATDIQLPLIDRSGLSQGTLLALDRPFGRVVATARTSFSGCVATPGDSSPTWGGRGIVPAPDSGVPPPSLRSNTSRGCVMWAAALGGDDDSAVEDSYAADSGRAGHPRCSCPGDSGRGFDQVVSNSPRRARGVSMSGGNAGFFSTICSPRAPMPKGISLSGIGTSFDSALTSPRARPRGSSLSGGSAGFDSALASPRRARPQGFPPMLSGVDAPERIGVSFKHLGVEDAGSASAAASFSGCRGASRLGSSVMVGWDDDDGRDGSWDSDDEEEEDGGLDDGDDGGPLSSRSNRPKSFIRNSAKF